MNHSNPNSVHRPLILEQLTLLDLAPAQLLAVAEASGFDAIGLRLIAARGSKFGYPLWHGTPEAAEFVRRVADSPVAVNDIETLALGSGSRPDDYLGALEFGASVGARYFNVTGNDEDIARLTEKFGELVHATREFGITPLLEPMAWKPLNSLRDALTVVDGAGAGGVMLDPLHLRRCGESFEVIRGLPAALVPYIQLCDASLEPPDSDAVIDLLPFCEGPMMPATHLEAAYGRVMPGQGELPLASLVESVASTTPVAIEVPALPLRQTMSALAFAQLAHERLSDYVTSGRRTQSQ